MTQDRFDAMTEELGLSELTGQEEQVTIGGYMIIIIRYLIVF